MHSHSKSMHKAKKRTKKLVAAVMRSSSHIKSKAAADKKPKKARPSLQKTLQVAMQTLPRRTAGLIAAGSRSAVAPKEVLAALPSESRSQSDVAAFAARYRTIATAHAN